MATSTSFDRALPLNGPQHLYNETNKGEYVLFYDPNHGGSARYVVRHNDNYLILGYYQADEVPNVANADVANPWHATFTNKNRIPRVTVTFHKHTHHGSQKADIVKSSGGTLKFKWDDGNCWQSIRRSRQSDKMFQETTHLLDPKLVLSYGI